MCGVLGIVINNFSEEKHGELVRNLFRESMIRGKHATGASYVKNGKVITVKEPIPADQFIEKQNLEEWVNEDGHLYCIGHIRYSTSDLRFNQPMATDSLAIAHNGVITQEHPSKWYNHFMITLVCDTQNDSELVLRAMERNFQPLVVFPKASMAVTALYADKKLVAYRNESRPLWHSMMHDAYVFASTKDILKRAGWPNPAFKTDPYTIYTIDGPNGSEYTIENQIEDLQ